MTSILVRCPEGLKREVQREAERMGISVNAFVLNILWQWKEDRETRAKGGER